MSVSKPPPRSRTPRSMRIPNVDFDVANAARRVVETSLGVVAGERVAVVVDAEREALGDTIAQMVGVVGAQSEVVHLEQLGRRPIRAVPPPLRTVLSRVQASVLLIGWEEGEAPMRLEYVQLVTELRLRHAHMIGVGRGAMLAGFTADQQRIQDVTRAVRTRLRPDSVLRVRSAAGTDLEVKLDERCRWQERVGIIRPGRWENLPSGEIYTCPADVNGVYVADASVGGPAGAAAGVLARSPVRVEVRSGTCKSVQCADRALGGALEEALRAERNGDRVGMIVLGTNVGMNDATGDLAADQNLPGLHLGFGATFADQTGASWDSPTQLLLTSTGTDVDLDGAPLLRSGRYLVL